MRPTQFLMIRHGESESNRAGRFTGWTNSPLTTGGLLQAQKLGAYLSEIGFLPDLILASDLDRAVDTAEIVQRHLSKSASKLVILEALRERDFGSLTGIAKSAIRSDPVQWAEAQGTVESDEALARRVNQVLEDVRSSIADGLRVVVVTHSHTMRLMAASVSGKAGWPSPENGECWLFDKDFYFQGNFVPTGADRVQAIA